ncbi:hypothetical protein KF840_17330 [bacterium]|nr:hypothetical protein [bacterium]
MTGAATTRTAADRLRAICGLLLLLVALPAGAACTGDCDRDRTVSIAELLIGVNAVLDGRAPLACAAFDSDGDGAVGIDELVAAVGHALGRCPADTQAFVVTSTFEEGSFATVALAAPRAVTPSTPQRRIFRDAVARGFGDLIYVLNRLYADNLQVLDPANGLRTRLQCSTGNGTNPHDIAVVSAHKAYVTLFERRELLIVDPAAPRDCSGFLRGRIDLSSLADADGIPDMDQMAIVGDRLYVSLQRLDIKSVLRLPATNGALAVVDLATDRVLGGIELTGANPFAATKGLTVRDGALWIAEAGEFNVLDGGLERVDLRTGTASGFVVTEAALGGDITDFAIVSDHLAYAIISRPGFTNALVSFDPATGRLLATHHTSSGYTLFDIELNDRGELYLADRTRRAPGIRVFRASDGTPLTDGVLDLVLPPFEIVFR